MWIPPKFVVTKAIQKGMSLFGKTVSSEQISELYDKTKKLMDNSGSLKEFMQKGGITREKVNQAKSFINNNEIMKTLMAWGITPDGINKAEEVIKRNLPSEQATDDRLARFRNLTLK